MFNRRNALRLAALSLVPGHLQPNYDVAAARLPRLQANREEFAQRGNPARTGEMPGKGLTVSDPVVVEGHFADERGGSMRLGMEPAVYSDVVFVGGYEFTAHSGLRNANWYSTEPDRFSYAAVGSDVVVVSNGKTELHGFDVWYGDPLWVCPGVSGATARSPVIADGRVYVAKSGASDTDIPVALDVKTGTEIWSYSGIDRVETPMSVFSDQVLFLDGDSRLVALDASTGNNQWTRDVSSSSYGPIAISEGVAVLGLWAFDLSSGDRHWGRGDFGSEQFSDAAVADGVACYGRSDGHLIALDLRTGEQLWEFNSGLEQRLGERYFPNPAIANGIVYFGVNLHLFAIDLKSGKEYWRYAFEGYEFEELGSPVLGNGYLWVTVGHGRLYGITNQVKKYALAIDGEIYAEPTYKSAVVASLLSGTEFDDVGPVEVHDGGEWRKVTIGTITGWVDEWAVRHTVSPEDYEDLVYTP